MLQQIRTLLNAAPFRSFEVRCSSGDRFLIDHPENAAVVRHWVTIALPDGENVVTLSALHIVGIVGPEKMAV